jgi:hypothetical protein
MADHESSQTENPAPIESRITEILPGESQREHFLRLISQLESDNAALVILKGHLVIEERLTAVIEKFVFHPEHLDKARLTFAQKLAIARSLSLDEDTNSMWNLIEKLNTLRNKLSHSLDGEPRARAMEAVKTAYVAECSGKVTSTKRMTRSCWRASSRFASGLCMRWSRNWSGSVIMWKRWIGS